MHRGVDGAEGNTFAHFLLEHGFAESDSGGGGRIGPMANDTATARKDLLIKGLLLFFLGLIVLVAPAFIKAPGFAEAVGGSSVVGWFALVLGTAFLGQWALRRNK